MPARKTMLNKMRYVQYLIGRAKICAYYVEYKTRYLRNGNLYEKSINTTFVDNGMIYNFCMTYFMMTLAAYEKNAKNQYF